MLKEYSVFQLGRDKKKKKITVIKMGKMKMDVYEINETVYFSANGFSHSLPLSICDKFS